MLEVRLYITNWMNLEWPRSRKKTNHPCLTRGSNPVSYKQLSQSFGFRYVTNEIIWKLNQIRSRTVPAQLTWCDGIIIFTYRCYIYKKNFRVIYLLYKMKSIYIYDNYMQIQISSYMPLSVQVPLKEHLILIKNGKKN